jgi:hypothetical protein
MRGVSGRMSSSAGTALVAVRGESCGICVPFPKVELSSDVAPKRG